MAEIRTGQSSYSKIQQLSKIRMFDAVRVYPDKVTFDGQDDDEHIILFLRQHPVVLLVPIVRAFGMFLLFILFTWIIGIIAPEVNMGTFGVVLIIIGLAAAVTQLIYSFAKWYFTVTIITSSRLVDLDFMTIMNSQWSTTMLRSIQDVSYASPGFLNALFDMASLQIQTASHKNYFELSNLPKARDVQDIIMDLVETEKENGSIEHI